MVNSHVQEGEHCQVEKRLENEKHLGNSSKSPDTCNGSSLRESAKGRCLTRRRSILSSQDMHERFSGIHHPISIQRDEPKLPEPSSLLSTFATT